MHNDKFTSPFINFVNEEFPEQTHYFFIWGGQQVSKNHIPITANIRTVGLTDRNHISRKITLCIFLSRLLIACVFSRKLYLHGLFNERLLFFLSMFRFFLKKTNWVMWGGDLYDVSDAAWARKYLFLSRRQIVNRISQISSLVPADYTFLVKKTNYAGKQCRALYLNAYSYKFLASLKSNMPLKQSEELRVIIGNSATPSNRHKDIISGLAQIQNVKMRIYAPLSYGDPNYAKEIIAFGQKHLGDKFFPITDFMPPYEYAAFLSTMDMGVFYLDRQQALGNIYTLLFLEKAVLLNRTNPAWSFLEDELNVHLFDTEDFLSNLLLPVSCNSLAADNSRKISRLFDVDYLKTIWNENFAS